MVYWSPRLSVYQSKKEKGLGTVHKNYSVRNWCLIQPRPHRHDKWDHNLLPLCRGYCLNSCSHNTRKMDHTFRMLPLDSPLNEWSYRLYRHFKLPSLSVKVSWRMNSIALSSRNLKIADNPPFVITAPWILLKHFSGNNYIQF